MNSVSQYFQGLFQGIASLITGMRVTLRELFAKKVTQQYPENRATLVISDRFKCELIMPHDNNNQHACIACGICQMNCPNGTIKVITKQIETEDSKKKKILDEYWYDQGLCTFCNLCVITCPYNAIKFDNDFESAVYNRNVLKMKLNHPGSSVREKEKKTAPAPKPAPTTEGAALAEKKNLEPAIKNESTDTDSKPQAESNLKDKE